MREREANNFNDVTFVPSGSDILNSSLLFLIDEKKCRTQFIHVCPFEAFKLNRKFHFKKKKKTRVIQMRVAELEQFEPGIPLVAVT